MADTKAIRRIRSRIPKASPVRVDGWANVLTGIGVLGKDKTLGQTFGDTRLIEEQTEQLWGGDDICARIIETIPDEMLREGFEVQIEGDKETAEEVETAAEELDVIENLRTAMHYARAYGGAGIVLGVNDGASNLEIPLNEERVQSVDWLSVRSPRELQAVRYYADPRKAKYGEVSVYRLVPIDSPPDAPVGDMPLIHESRIIRFGGVRTSRGSALRGPQPGWDRSVLDRVIKVVGDFQGAWGGAAILLQDFAPPTLKLKGLAKILAEEGEVESLKTRAAALELARSIARVVILDSEEEYKRETVPVTGLAELLDKLMLRLAAAAEMPVSLLMGQAPAGLNATGDSDIRFFYDRIAARREQHLRPKLKRLLRLIMLAKEGPCAGTEPENWDFKFNPLWQETEKEKAETRKIVAETDAIMIDKQVVTPQQVAKSRYGGDTYSTEMQIDTDLIDEMLEDEELQLKELGAAPEPTPEELDEHMKAAGIVPAKPGAPAGGKPPFPPKK